MDPRYSAQDVVRCTLCKISVAPMYCDICLIHLCEGCIEKHTSDASKYHKVMPLKNIGSTSDYPKCPNHSTKPCELHCKQCDIPVCIKCVSLKEHKGHDFIEMVKQLAIKKKILIRDLLEMEDSIFPKYQEVALSLPVHVADVFKNADKLTSAINRHGEDLHREIDAIITTMKSDLEEMNSNYLTFLGKYEVEITSTISEITKSIDGLKKLLDSKDICLVSAYKSRNTEFRKLPPKIKVTLPSFTSHIINREQIYNQFGVLSVLYFTEEEQAHTVEAIRAESSSTSIPLLDEPTIISALNTRYTSLYNVACLGDDKIWTSGTDNIMRLYTLKGQLKKSIQTKTKDWPEDITTTTNGDLVYIDSTEKTVNLVKNASIQTVIQLQGWRPLNVCSSSSGDLLVVMDLDSDYDLKQTKVVRYSDFTEKQCIQFNERGEAFYSFGVNKYINENRNLDICVSDCAANAVVVVNQAGKLRFTYVGHSFSTTYTKGTFTPVGITTDGKGRILIADVDNHLIHILDPDGQFLRYIDSCDLHNPWGLSMDTKDNLFVAERGTRKVKKIQYSV